MNDKQSLLWTMLISYPDQILAPLDEFNEFTKLRHWNNGHRNSGIYPIKNGLMYPLVIITSP